MSSISGLTDPKRVVEQGYDIDLPFSASGARRTSMGPTTVWRQAASLRFAYTGQQWDRTDRPVAWLEGKSWHLAPANASLREKEQ